MLDGINLVMVWFTKNIIKPIFGKQVVFDLIVLIVFVLMIVFIVLLIRKLKQQKALIQLKNKRIDDLVIKLSKKVKKGK